mmetsp:Transcript_1548/g.2451  ORF Transcript_1548/g.2451 Transcript_1548/m.2451 type:complete len:517 (-) Transcript_1548:141-1691(-)|eukprot:CAMPEP_0195285614 /NCGR_PEP_ID=MMETSP0707-20130614/3381_1 /TAXON_ID=33640 /ORGANISM="Asterionellopsis glacialis, Strain CCMP134" /LENGTH=516 /DNA_ID=CAMNT_0040345135 /DNA_START=363 /DNA_END=1913 /DNA_ORIENTATION=-
MEGGSAGFFDDYAGGGGRQGQRSGDGRGQHHHNNNNRNRNYHRHRTNNHPNSKPRQSELQVQQHNQRRAGAAGVARKQHYAPKGPADITVIVNRCDLWDIKKTGAAALAAADDHAQSQPKSHSNVHVAPYHFAPDVSAWVMEEKAKNHQTVSVIRVPHNTTIENGEGRGDFGQVVDTSMPNPYPPSVCHDKYWAQRRRLFSRFDAGVQLDGEGWYSVTPEVIADHVGNRVGELSNSAAFRRGMPGSDISQHEGIVVLDAFGGCGGNTIAFAKQSPDLISKVVAVDLDRTKLRKAAHNAAIYGIPKDKIVFVECNTLFILEHCYKNGSRASLQGKCIPEDIRREEYAGFQIGGIELLPSRIDAVFMDPPWGGVDYNSLGKDGYDLEKNMKIAVSPYGEPDVAEAPPEDSGGIGDDFFDTFSSGATTLNPTSKSFNPGFNQCAGECINGVQLVTKAAEATKSRLVIYDLPRNTNKTSLGKAALAAGYRGNIKLEEHYLNGRLKTVTAYFGADYSGLLH